MKALIQELRSMLGERKCPPGMYWDPKRKKCIPQQVFGRAMIGFRAGKRGPGHHPHGGGHYGGKGGGSGGGAPSGGAAPSGGGATK
jgi:hypothetical protein